MLAAHALRAAVRLMVGLVCVVKPFTPELTDVYEDEDEQEEEEERCRERDVGRITFGETEEMLEGGVDGACCSSPPGGGDSGLGLVTVAPWSSWTAAVSRLSAWLISSAAGTSWRTPRVSRSVLPAPV